MQIQEKPKFNTPFEWIGGEANVKALVERFYDLMDLDESYSALRAAHPGPLDNARQKTFWFLCGWLGGPQYYTEKFGSFWGQSPNSPSLRLTRRVQRVALQRNWCLTPITHTCPSKSAAGPSASKSATSGWPA